MELKDQLSWNEFLKNSNKGQIISKIQPYNRLIAHTKNLFVVAGYGSFTDGYVLIITKDFIPSFGLVVDKVVAELNFLIKLFKFNNNKKYHRNSIVFEHGMCACVGGLDRAHVHIMSVNKNTSETILKSSIEKVLQKRKVGINYVKYRNHKFFNIHDIDQFINDPLSIENKDYEINGKILKLNDIRNLNFDEWPRITLNHINKGGHYVYFRSDSNNASFLTTQDFKTQFGREVIFENELMLCKKFQNEIKYLKEKYPLLEFWKWQNWMFENKIIETVNNSRQYLNDYKSVFFSEYEQYHLEII